MKEFANEFKAAAVRQLHRGQQQIGGGLCKSFACGFESGAELNGCDARLRERRLQDGSLQF